MDLSKIPTEDLLALRSGDLTKVSTTTLKLLRGGEVVPETTIVGQAKEFAKGLGGGALNLLESAGVGAANILPDQQEKAAQAAVRSGIGSLRESVAPTPGYEDAVGSKFGQAVGSTLPFFALAPLGPLGIGVGAGLGIAAGSGEATTRAQKGGATSEEESRAAMLGAGVGATEALPIFRFSKGLKQIPKGGLDIVKRAALQGGEEAAQEAAANLAQNAIERGYNPDQELVEGLGEAAAYGGGTGAFISAITDLALGRRGASSSSANTPTGQPTEVEIRKQNKLAQERAEAERVAQDKADLDARMMASREEREQIKVQKEQQKLQQAELLASIAEQADANTLLAQRNELGREETPQAKQAVAAINRRLRDIVNEKVKTPPTEQGTVPQEPPVITPQRAAREEKRAAASVFSAPEPQQMEIRETVGLPERPVVNAEDGIAEPVRRPRKDPNQRALPFNVPQRPVEVYREALSAPSKFDTGLDPNEPVSLADIARAVRVDMDARPGRVNQLFGKTNLPKLMEAFVGKTPTEIAAMEQPKGIPLSEIIYGELSKPAQARQPTEPTTTTEITNANPEPAIEPTAGNQRQAPLFGTDGGDVSPDNVQRGAERPVPEQPAPRSVGVSKRDTGDVVGGESVQPAALAPLGSLPSITPKESTSAPPALPQVPAPAVAKEDPATLWDEGFDVRDTPFKSLPKEQQDLWIDAVDAGVATDARYNEIVDRVKRNERAEKAKPAQAEPDADPDEFLYRKVDGTAPKGLPAKTVQDIADTFKANAKNLPNIKVVQSVKEVPQEVQDRAGEDIDNVRGFYSPAQNEVYLIADNTPDSKDAQITLMHELVGHYGLRAILGKDYARTMKAAKGNALVQKLLSGRKPTDADAAAAFPTDIDVEEVIAELAEGFATGTAPKPARPLLRRVIEAVRSALRGLGMDITLTDNEVAGLIADSYAYVFEGKGRDRRTAPQRQGVGVARIKKNTPNEDVQADVEEVQEVTGRMEPYYPQEKSVFADAKEFWRGGSKVDIVRNKFVNQASSVARKFSDLYSQGFRDSFGNISPMGLYRQAQAAPQLIQSMLRTGGVQYSADRGQYETTKVLLENPTSSLAEGTEVHADMILTKVKEMANTYRIDAKQAELLVDTTLRGLRYGWMIDRNAELEQKANEVEAEGKKRLANDIREKMYLLPENDLRSASKEAEMAKRNIEKYDEIRQIRDIMNAVRKHAIGQAVAAGRLSPEQGKEWSEGMEYVPFDRVREQDEAQSKRKMVARGLVAFSDVPSLRGSETREVGNIINNYFDMLGWMTSQTMRNKAAVSVLEDMRLADYARKVKDPKAASNEAAVVRVFEGGESSFYELLDEVDVAAFDSLPIVHGPILNALQKSTRLLRTTVTAMPPFAISQVIQDAQRAALFSGTKKPFKVMGRTLTNFPTFLLYNALGKKHQLVRELENIGVVGAYDLNVLNPTEEARIEAGLEKLPKWKTVIRALDKITTTSDLAARAAVYQTMIEESGGDKARAAQTARELINFRRRGTSELVSFGVAAIPFFNAYIQGMDNIYRALNGIDSPSALQKNVARAKFIKAMIGATTIGTAYALMMAGDDEYEEAEDYLKDRAWLMPGGVRIPMPAELGTVFKVLPERVIRYIRREGTPEEQRILTATTEYLKSAWAAYSSPNVTPQLAKPIVEWVTNYSFFTGRAIVPDSLAQKEAFRQVGSNTSEPARIIGNTLGLSPMKVENFLAGVFGMAGSMALQMGDAMLTDRGDRPLYKMPLLSTFTYDPIGSKPRSEFYDLADKINRVKTTYDDLSKNDPEKAAEYLEKKNHMKLHSAAGWRDARLDQISRLRAMKKYIEENKKMSGADKRQQLDALRILEQEFNSDVRGMASYLRAN